MSTVTVATFKRRSQAEPVRNRLAESHIPAEIHHESTLEWLWFSATPVVRVRLKVRTTDYKEALRLLHDWDEAEGILWEAIRCPECGSSRVEYPQFTRKFFLPNLIGLLAALGVVQRELYCEDCHYTWPKEGSKRSRIRPHSAPYYFIEGIAQREMEPKPEGEKISQPLRSG